METGAGSSTVVSVSLVVVVERAALVRGPSTTVDVSVAQEAKHNRTTPPRRV